MVIVMLNGVLSGLIAIKNDGNIVDFDNARLLLKELLKELK